MAQARGHGCRPPCARPSSSSAEAQPVLAPFPALAADEPSIVVPLLVPQSSIEALLGEHVAVGPAPILVCLAEVVHKALEKGDPRHRYIVSRQPFCELGVEGSGDGFGHLLRPAELLVESFTGNAEALHVARRQVFFVFHLLYKAALFCNPP